MEKVYQTGDVVFARFSGDGHYYWATITSIDETGIHVSYADQCTDTLKTEQLRLFETCLAEMKPLGNWENRGTFYPCIIHGQDDTTGLYQVTYTQDGIKEDLPLHQLGFKETRAQRKKERQDRSSNSAGRTRLIERAGQFFSRIRSGEKRLLRALLLCLACYLILAIYMVVPSGVLRAGEPNVAPWMLGEETMLYASIRPGPDTEGIVLLPAGASVQPLAWITSAGYGLLTVQVQTSNDEIGFIRANLLTDQQRRIAERLPQLRINHLVRTDYEVFSNRVSGQPLRAVLRRYGPVTAAFPAEEAGRQLIYLRHLDMMREGTRYLGVFLQVDETNQVLDIRMGEEKTERLIDKLPMSAYLRRHESLGLVSRPYHILPTVTQAVRRIVSRLGQTMLELHWTTRFLAVALGVVYTVAMLYLLLSIPKFLLIPLRNVIYLIRIFSNRVAGFLIKTLSLAGLYLFFLVLNQPQGDELFLAFGMLAIFSIWNRREMSQINYHRCPNCHTMYRAVDHGTEFIGKSKTVTEGYRDHYTGTTQEGNTQVEHYTRHNTRTTHIFKNYRDHRRCDECGCQWTVGRQIMSSRIHEES